MSSASSPAASSAASRAKAVPKTKKKPPPPSPSSATSQQSPSSFLLSAQAQAISSDSEGSLDDIVFDNTGEFFLCVLSPAANLKTTFPLSFSRDLFSQESTLLSSWPQCKSRTTLHHPLLPFPMPLGAPSTSQPVPASKSNQTSALFK